LISNIVIQDIKEQYIIWADALLHLVYV